MTNGWYNTAKQSEFLNKEADLNGIRKGLGMGMGLGAIPMGLALMTQPNMPSQSVVPQKTTIQAPQQNTPPKTEAPKTVQKEQPQEQSSSPSMQEIRNFISPWEGGAIPKVYKDSKGINTVGIGFNVDSPNADSLLKQVGTTRKEVLSGKALTTEQINKLFDISAKIAIKDANEWLPNLSSLPKNVQLIVIDLSYNLGGPSLRTFKQTQSFLSKQDFKSAANALEKSKWYGQVGNRSKHHVSVLREASKQGLPATAQDQTKSLQSSQPQQRP